MSLNLLLVPNTLGPWYLSSINTASMTVLLLNVTGTLTFPSLVTPPTGPYVIATSGAEVNTTVNLSSAVTTGTANVIYRKFGNWVDLYVNYPSNVSVGVNNTFAIGLANALGPGYRPAAAFTFSIMVIDTGSSPSFVPGQCTIDQTGSINIRRLGPTNWVAGNNWGFDTFFISFPI